MAAIDKQQIRKIYAIGNALGIVERGNDDDNLHVLVASLTGKDSVKALTYAEAQVVITDLQRRQGAVPLPRHKPKTHTERPGGATEGQQRKVWALDVPASKTRHNAQHGLPGGAAVRDHQEGTEGGRWPPAAVCMAGLPDLQQADRGIEEVCGQREEAAARG